MMARFDEVTDLSVFESVMRVNYLGCVYLTHHALPYLKASRGQIVVMASMAGLTGVPTRTGYAASKHAVIGFYDSLRIELAGSGVDVTVIAPDFVQSRDPSPLRRARRAPAGAEPDAGGAPDDRGGVRRAHAAGDGAPAAHGHPVRARAVGTVRPPDRARPHRPHRGARGSRRALTVLGA